EASDHLAWALYRFFVRDDTPLHQRERPEAAAGVIRRLATTLRRSKFEVKPALRELFLSEHFYDDANAQTRIKSPAELVVGAVRSLRTPTRDLGALVDAMERMGQELFFPPSVAGWAGGRAWINTSSLFVRQNALVFLISGKAPIAQRDSDEPYDP